MSNSGSCFYNMQRTLRSLDANRERLTNDALQLLIDDMLKTNAAEVAIPDLGALLLPQVRDLIDQNFGTDTKSGSRVISDLGIDPITVQIKYLGDLAWSNYQHQIRQPL